MIVDLPATTVSNISKALVKIREEGGAVALGRVLTLIIATHLGQEEEAIEAANDASREHPMRVIVVSTDDDGVPQGRRGASRRPDPRRRRRRAPARSSCSAPTARPRATRRDWSPACSSPTPRSWSGGRGSRPRRRPPPPSAASRPAGSRMRPRSRIPQDFLFHLGADVRPGRHRLRLDPAHPVAGAARRGPRPAAVRAHHGRRRGRCGRLPLHAAPRRVAASAAPGAGEVRPRLARDRLRRHPRRQDGARVRRDRARARDPERGATCRSRASRRTTSPCHAAACATASPRNCVGWTRTTSTER